MSCAWSFHSFSDEGFRRVFGETPPGRAGEVVAAVAADLDVTEPEVLAALRAVLTAGISYDGDAPRAVDEAVKLAFSPEGLADELRVEDLSPDGLHPTVVAELIARLKAPAPLLSCLLRGRRFGQSEPSDCEYCLFSADEVPALLREARDARAAGGEWSADYLPELVEECLVEPFEAAGRAGRPVFCHLS